MPVERIARSCSILLKRLLARSATGFASLFWRFILLSNDMMIVRPSARCLTAIWICVSLLGWVIANF